MAACGTRSSCCCAKYGGMAASLCAGATDTYPELAVLRQPLLALGLPASQHIAERFQDAEQCGVPSGLQFFMGVVNSCEHGWHKSALLSAEKRHTSAPCSSPSAAWSLLGRSSSSARMRDISAVCWAMLAWQVSGVGLRGRRVSEQGAERVVRRSGVRYLNSLPLGLRCLHSCLPCLQGCISSAGQLCQAGLLFQAQGPPHGPELAKGRPARACVGC
jgi:hypothetical protein